jgi:hypothetical protein
VLSRTSHAGRLKGNCFLSSGLDADSANEDDQQPGKNTPLGLERLKRKRSAAWFDGRNCSLEASTASLIYWRNTVQNGSFRESPFFSKLAIAGSSRRGYLRRPRPKSASPL